MTSAFDNKGIIGELRRLDKIFNQRNDTPIYTNAADRIEYLAEANETLMEEITELKGQDK